MTDETGDRTWVRNASQGKRRKETVVSGSITYRPRVGDFTRIPLASQRPLSRQG